MAKDYRYYAGYQRKQELCARVPTSEEIKANGGKNDFIYLQAYTLRDKSNDSPTYHLTRMRAIKLDTESFARDINTFLDENNSAKRQKALEVLEQSIAQQARPGQLMLMQRVLEKKMVQFSINAPKSDFFNNKLGELEHAIAVRLKDLPPAQLHHYQHSSFSLELDKPVAWEDRFDAKLNTTIPTPVAAEIKYKRKGLGDRRFGIKISDTPVEDAALICSNVPNLPLFFSELQHNDTPELPLTEIGTPQTPKLKSRYKSGHVDHVMGTEHPHRATLGPKGINAGDLITAKPLRPGQVDDADQPPAPDEEPDYTRLALSVLTSPEWQPDKRIILSSSMPQSEAGAVAESLATADKPKWAEKWLKTLKHDAPKTNDYAYIAYIPKKEALPSGTEEAARAPFFCIEFQTSDGTKPMFAFEMQYTNNPDNPSGPKIPTIKHSPSLSTAERQPTEDDEKGGEKGLAQRLFQENARDWVLKWVNAYSAPTRDKIALVDTIFPESPHVDAATLPKKAPNPDSERTKRRLAASEPSAGHAAAVEGSRAGVGDIKRG